MAARDFGKPVTLLSTVTKAASFEVLINIEHWSKFSVQVDVTNQSLADFSVELQASVNGVNYTDAEEVDFSITADGTYILDIADAAYPMAKLVFTRNAGEADFNISYYGKE